MTSVSLIIIQALLFAMTGLAVRSQFSLFRGLDLMIGACILVAAEVFVFVARFVPSGGLGTATIATAASISAAIALALLWNCLIQWIWPARQGSGTAILVASLGAQAFVSGFIGVVRGPGLVQANLDLANFGAFVLSVPLLYGFVVLSVGSACAFGLLRSRIGHALWLYGDDPEFAVEIGVERGRLLRGTSAIIGVLTGTVGAYIALSEGSRPELGLNLFLYGAASALLFPSGTPKAAFVGGLLLGAVHLAVQLYFSFVVAELLLFAGVAVLLISRGSSRSKEGVR